MASSTIILKAVGLITSPNQLDLPDGALQEATNVIIHRTNVVEPRRGYKLYGDALPNGSDRLKQMFEYKQRIFRHFDDQLQYDDGTGTFLDITGSYSETESGLRLKSVESNGNVYFTTSNGIKKISVKDEDDFDNNEVVVEDTGVVKAIDFQVDLDYTYANKTGFLPQDSAVAYRILWNKKDNNGNLIRGTASQREIIFNPLRELLVRDFNRVLDAIDRVSDDSTTAKVGDGDYIQTLSLPLSASDFEIRDNLISLASKIDNDIFLADDVPTATLEISGASISSGVLTITFSSGSPLTYLSPGSKVYLDGFDPDTGDLDGIQDIVTVDATTITINTSATGTVTLDSPTIHYGEYRSISEPLETSIPATNEQLVSVQTYMDNIITQLTSENTAILDSASPEISSLDITTTANTSLIINIPESITTDFFFQIYRSNISSATGVSSIDDIVPDDEMAVVYEAFPTDAEITAGVINVDDNTPDLFKGEFLYSNETTGEGILQSNDVPPFAKDVNRYRNVVFYANTRTIHRLTAQLIGLDGLFEDISNLVTPTMTIADDNESITLQFVEGIQEIANYTIDNTSIDGTYISVYTQSGLLYKIWFDNTGSTSEPASIGEDVSVKITSFGLTNVEIAQEIHDRMSIYVDDFIMSTSTDEVAFTQVNFGETTDATVGTTSFSVVITQGAGENASENKVLLSNSPSVGIAVDETTRSIIRVINQNDDSPVYAHYLSNAGSSPGQILFEKRELDEIPFFIVTNTGTSGSSFNPDFSPNNTITAIDTGTDIITSSVDHNLVNGDVVVISGSDSTPNIDGAYTVTIEPTYTSKEFKLDGITITSAGTPIGSFINGSLSEVSENEERKNRIYFSKFQQPEAVPIVNFFDVGAKEKAILRIFPLRDSLFVFKEDGLYRISGEVAPFTNALFDSSCILLAPDSLGVANNLVFGWTTQGVQTVSESGVDLITGDIEDSILKLSSNTFTNFKTATWGVGYDSDNSYIVYTVNKTSDTIATIGYRYSTTTNTWTNYDQTTTCGILNDTDDRIYLGAGDTNYIDQERKTFTREDYADREIDSFIATDKYDGTIIELPLVSEFEAGDVIVQSQGLTVYDFNVFLKQLDNDPSVGDSDYFTTLESSAGDNMRAKLETLSIKLDSDSGVTDTDYFTTISNIAGTITKIESGTTSVITSVAHGLVDGRKINITGSDSVPSIDGEYVVTIIDVDNFSIEAKVRTKGSAGSYTTLIADVTDQTACYNAIIEKLNVDTGVFFSNYRVIDNLNVFEAVILSVNNITKKITVNTEIQFIVGDIVIHKAIRTSFTYTPTTMGDPLSFKHFREATAMLETNAITLANLEFASDLHPALNSVQLIRDGNGGFGSTAFGSNFFGGASNSAPLRTYIPRENMRSRYLIVKFVHAVARETYAAFGITVTANITNSTRAYR